MVVTINYGEVAWGDYDLDGNLDLAVGGYTETSSYAGIFRNNGDETFGTQSRTDADFWVYPHQGRTVYAPWNGFLNMTVITEVINSGNNLLTVEITLYGMNGNKSNALSETIKISIAPHEQKDFIINDFRGYEEDRYGIVVLKFSNEEFTGRSTYYKMASANTSWPSGNTETDDFDFAFTNPFVGTISGLSQVSFNTYQPSNDPAEADYLVPNWLTIINADPKHRRAFTVRKYDMQGNPVEAQSELGTVTSSCNLQDGDIHCSIAPYGRLDLDGGHVSPGPRHAGLLEIIPDDSSAPYTAHLIRYGMQAQPLEYSNRYSFGVYQNVRSQAVRTQVMPVWSDGTLGTPRGMHGTGAHAWTPLSMPREALLFLLLEPQVHFKFEPFEPCLAVGLQAGKAIVQN